MKGKALNLKIILSILMAITTGLIFGLGVSFKPSNNEIIVDASTKVSLGTTASKEEFSALFNGGVIFSVEKVKVSSNETNNIPNDLESGAYDKMFYATYDATRNDETFTFKNIPNGLSNKTVIDNGGFAKLDNVYKNGKFALESEDSYQEAMLISFGSYIYKGENALVEVADNTKHAGITFLEVIVKKDGELLDKSKLPENRSINDDGGPFFDFAFLITQNNAQDSNEGYYEFSFTYYVNDKAETANFGFYLINNTSYTQSIDSEGYGYNAKPTLGWIDGASDQNFEKNALSNGYVRYLIGNNGINNNKISYPTITYDYTKYKLAYTHTANQKNTSYELNVLYQQTANEKTAKLEIKSSSSDGVSTVVYPLNDYQKDSVNLVTIMLTEPGTYVADYEFLYDGYVGTTSPSPVFETDEIKLSVHGLSTYYSKSGYEGAKMQYFQIAKSAANNVDLVIPYGYEITKDTSSQKDKKLGFAYSLVESQEREGTILSDNNQNTNALLNYYLKNNTFLAGVNDSQNFYDYLTANIKDKTKIDNLDKVLDDLNNDDVYVKTNQGSLWIEGDDSFNKSTIATSFYFYSPTMITAESLFKKDSGVLTDESSCVTFTNTTTFNSKGYYLVFVNVLPNGMSDSSTFWQVFAFQYTSSSTNINIETTNEDGTISAVANGKYTNKEVSVSWKKPGMFDRTINAWYYSVVNQNYSKDQLLKLTPKKLEVVEEKDGYLYASLGSNVDSNTFVRYLIRLESGSEDGAMDKTEIESATHKMFTIDKQGITNIKAYLIEEMRSGTSVYYSYATDKNNYPIVIQNAVTDGYASLSWNDKDSGANIYATYCYTPFAVSSDAVDASKVINGNGGATWISTNYNLGTTIYGADLKKSNSQYLVESDCVLFNQGIYIIDLYDEAGNKSRYAFVIDRTENYFNVEGNCVSNANLLYGNNVKYSIGEYKVFNLDVDSLASDSIVKEFVQKAAANKLDTFENYYLGSGNNASALTQMFKKLASDNNYYFTIKNDSVVAYNENKLDPNIRVDIKGNGEFNYVESPVSYYKRTIYAVAENHRYRPDEVKTHSYVSIEINKDNARGSVYYSNDNSFDDLPSDGNESDKYKKLQTGTDWTNDQGAFVGGIHGAGATSAKHIAFVWNMGTGSFEVESVTYKFYTLKTKIYNDNVHYFYSESDSADLYRNGTWNTGLGAELMSDNVRGFVKFNRSSDSKAGLYVVTRTYKDVTNADLGDDVKVKDYYFIVDRNGIIETDIGESIRIELMETESEFNSFSTQGTDYGTLSYVGEGESIDADRYNIYLTTTKLPATLNIPTGKYYTTQGTSAKYEAGQLNLTVYFYDRYKQLRNQYKDRTIKIYQSNGTEQINNDVFVADIYKYLTNSKYPNELVRSFLTESSENGEWLFLPGDYIIRIHDNVKDALGKNHIKYIGLRIATYEDNGPEVEIFNGYSKDDMNKVITENNTATVSQEFLKVVLPAYSLSETKKAQVDKNYIVVDQYLNGVRKDYLYHEYKPDSGIPLRGDASYSNYVTINNNGTPEVEDDSINIWLDTKLRDQFGAIDYKNLNTPLKYEITVRYKLNNYSLPYDDGLTISELTKYKNCYVYYTANEEKVDDFYYKTYTIVIDREAPRKNVEYLNKNDNLVNEYNKEFGTENMIESSVHQTNSNIYFTRQYTKYYQDGKQACDLYVYEVKETTPLNVEDISKIYVKELQDIRNVKLSLPLIDTSYYTRSVNAYELDDNKDGYGVYSGLNLTENMYYEIAEVDLAGNVTQYLIKYTNSSASVMLPFKVLTTLNENKQMEISSVLGTAENIFAIQANGTIERNTNFFKVEIKKVSGEIVYRCLTNLETDFDRLTETISKKLTDEGFGGFTLKLSTISGEKISHIKLYNNEIIKSLDTERLVTDSNKKPYKNSLGKESIYLLGANRTEIIDGQTVEFYATEITIKTADQETTYIAVIEADGNVKYYEKNFYEANKDDSNILRNKDVVYIQLKPETTYLITMKDVFGDCSPYRFNTSGYEFVIVEFDDVENDDSQDYYFEVVGKNLMYYGFTGAVLKYDRTSYTAEVAYKQFGNYQDYNIEAEVGTDIYNQLRFEAPNNRIEEYRVKLFYNGQLDRTYFITIDTRISSVGLKDVSSGEEKDDFIKVFNNVNFAQDDVITYKPATGRLTLYWNLLDENNYFNYDYRLYEVLKDGKGFRKYTLVGEQYIESEEGEEGLNLNGKTSTTLATKDDSEGLYKFVISVYSKDGYYLGNRVFVLKVQETNTKVYHVISNGKELLPNALFKYSEDLDTLTQTNPIFFRNGELLLDENIPMNLYITNQEYIVEELSSGVEMTKTTVDLGNNELAIFRISKKDAYDVFLGVLKIEKTNNLVENVRVNTTDISRQTSLTITTDKSEDIVVYADKLNREVNIVSKNKLILEIYYNNKLVTSQEFESLYEIEGNGQYSFIFKDLAGNVHEYIEDGDGYDPETLDKLEVCVLREVVVLLNGEAPIKNAFYNDQVELTIYASSKYQTGSISLKALRNGTIYYPQGNGPYTFSDYGTYKISISAKYEGYAETLTKVVTFTILNKNEARTSIDLTGLNGCEITTVLNSKGENKTTQFYKMLESATSNKGMNVSYEAIREYEMNALKEDKLNITSGKCDFTITYKVEDLIYPKREITVKFTLNNDVPTIACSLEKGESTTKGFTISFNTAVVYEQVGDSFIYINDRLVAIINEETALNNKEQKINTTYKQFGDGDYYVKLVSSSGIILDSYKVTIDEPLNASAILVIIVIVGAVLAVVITVIVLRRKMRIR